MRHNLTGQQDGLPKANSLCHAGDRGQRLPWIGFLAVTLFISCTTGEDPGAPLFPDQGWAIALHGGAGVISRDLPDSTVRIYYNALEEALSIGQLRLEEGTAALEVVEEVIRYLEDHELFNAGKGSVLTQEGTHELDAAIMDGATLEAGALTGLRTVKNPISLARSVMENSAHIFFSGDGAEEYADHAGVERVENEWFTTERRREQWERHRESSSSNLLYGPEHHSASVRFGTVGAVARDKDGNLAAGTSTGGMTGKMYGRVGDVPIIGAGTYANSEVAVSATGWGEQIMRHVSAHTIASYYEFMESSLDKAVDFVLSERLRPSEAGFVAVDKYGTITMKMNTEGMFRAGANETGFYEIAIWEESFTRNR